MVDGAERPVGAGRWLPGVVTLRAYQPAWLPRDIGAGLVLTALLVPAGMGYATAAGLPPITGLYATIVPLLVYAVLGPSRILVLGPDSSLAPLIAAAVVPLAAGDDGLAVGLAGLLALMTGGLIAAAGLARFGFVTDLLSAPVRHGYLNGIALVVIVGQLDGLLGFSVSADGLLAEMRALAEAVVAGEVVPTALAIGGSSLATIVVLRRFAPPVPGVLVAVAGATIISAALDLASTAGLAVIGPLPRGLPSFSIPPLDLETIRALAPAAVGIAFVTAADVSVLSRSYASRGGYPVDANQELAALGASSGAAGLFGGFPVSASASRTPVAEAAGARTQLTGVAGALAIVGLLVFAPALLADLPSAALAAVVIAAAASLVDLSLYRRLWQTRRSEFVLSLASFAGVAFIGVIEGIFLAVGLSVAIFVRRAWWPHDAILGRASGVKGYHDMVFYPEARRIPGLVLYRFDAPLFFANADVFRRRVLERIDAADPSTRWVVIAAEPITDIDSTAADELVELHGELGRAGIVLGFAELKDFVRERLRRDGTLERLERPERGLPAVRFFPTVGTAVSAYLAATGEPWVDWEEAAARPPEGTSG
jgi:high affinity sulfate transporter 1